MIRPALVLALVAGLLATPAGVAHAAARDPLAPTARSSQVARIVRPVLAHTAPEGHSPVRARIGTTADWVGGSVGLMVLGSRTSASGVQWLHVALPSRPNGVTGWVDRDAVQLVATRWRVVVDLAARRLTMLRDGRPMRSTRVVIGAPGTPTPRGRFAVYELVRQAPGADVGPWALHLTAHSRVLHAYDGGPGRIALHGREDDLLGDPLGSARSHGCVRMSSSLISWLAARLRPGTPVTIR